MKRILWVGDSTVAYNDIKTFPQTGIGQVFNLYCKREYEVIDYAKNGASSKSFYDSGRFEPAAAMLSEGDYLFIQFGHNDEKPKADRYTEPFTTYQEYLMRYADTARSKGAYPVFITPLSRRLFDECGKIKNSHTNYPTAVIELGRRENIPVVDLCSLSSDLYEGVGDEASKQWFMYFPAGTYENYQKDMVDNTHLHYEGAVKMAGLVANALRNIGGIYAEMLLN